MHQLESDTSFCDLFYGFCFCGSSIFLDKPCRIRSPLTCYATRIVTSTNCKFPSLTQLITTTRRRAEHGLKTDRTGPDRKPILPKTQTED